MPAPTTGACPDRERGAPSRARHAALAMALRLCLGCLLSACASPSPAGAPAANGGSSDGGTSELDAGSFVLPRSAAQDASEAARGPCDSTYLAVARLIFAGAGCASDTCHTTPGPDVPVAGLDLTEADAYQALIDVPARSPLSRSWLRLTPGDEQTSLLYMKLLAAEPFGAGALPEGSGAPMPLGLPPVDPDHLSALRTWIRAGAPQTGISPGTEQFVAACQAAGP